VGSLDFEGRKVTIEDGDSVASALFRAGVRTFMNLRYLGVGPEPSQIIKDVPATPELVKLA